MKEFDILMISSIEKILPHKKPKMVEKEGICLKNERYSYQVAIRNNSKELFFSFPKAEVESDIKEYVKVRVEKCVNCSTPIRNNSDDFYITKKLCMRDSRTTCS